ncbi:hypothetical protein HPP92_018775 [Vanilla planifolia]|uniref:Uncharacterized protein n=1 Tax=Vanilla planifolia TaxID=51239 RepID=A0A835Q5N6_VANPL|nr:hypothetical protein HPP92_018775 [Vanilla planifolia]
MAGITGDCIVGGAWRARRRDAGSPYSDPFLAHHLLFCACRYPPSAAPPSYSPISVARTSSGNSRHRELHHTWRRWIRWTCWSRVACRRLSERLPIINDRWSSPAKLSRRHKKICLSEIEV